MKKSELFQSIRKKLLAWFRRHRRDLPWRRTSDPYAIWLSEIMLQQTQVATAGPYFERFLKQFPTIGALAKANRDKVLKAWEGLGYYSRAANLHRTAQIIAGERGGKFPDTVEALLCLPGIGRYTAGAIASIAFNRDEPVLDGNVQRVLARVFRIRKNIKSADTQKALWVLAGKLLPPGRAGDFNQALMDLGAVVCVPRKPQCLVCPIRVECRANRHNEQNRIPVTSPAKPRPHYDIAVGVIRKGGRILIDRRKPGGLLGGLWEFPGGKRESGETLEGCLIREVCEELGIEITVGEQFATVDHAFSHFSITLHAFLARYVSGRPWPIGGDAVRWVTLDQLDQFAFPKANHRLIAVLRSKVREA